MSTGPNSEKNTLARQRAQAKYNAKPLQKKKRASRNKARRMMIKAGKAHKGDGKDVMHKNGNALVDKMSNFKMGTKRQNRSYARTRNAHKVNPRS
jgi:hypothetical protein